MDSYDMYGKQTNQRGYGYNNRVSATKGQGHQGNDSEYGYEEVEDKEQEMDL